MLSVIIPTFNRAALLEKALDSLVGQTLAPARFETIVVDNGSTDDTEAVVRSFQGKLGNLRYCRELRPGLHAGRHRGAREAKSDLLVYADDDIEAFPTWLQAIEASFEDREVVLVGGKCLPKYETEPPAWLAGMWSTTAPGERVLGPLSLIDLGEREKPVDPFQVYGCNFAIRRRVLLEAGGFHPDAMPRELIRYRGDGETHVSRHVQARGYRALYTPSASIRHWVPADRMSLEYFSRRGFNQGISDSYTAIRACRGIPPVPATPTAARGLFRRLVGKGFSALFSAAAGLDPRKRVESSSAGEEAAVRREFAAAYQRGYAYHQREVRNSPELLAWVLKSDYWSSQTRP